MDIWAICRRDHGLSWAEFEELTLPQFEALEERRQIEIRYGRFNAALVASMICSSSGVEDVSVFDFIPGFEDPEGKEKAKLRKMLKADVQRALMRVSDKPAKVKAVTRGLVNMLRENGVEDPEDLIREVFPEMEIS